MSETIFIKNNVSLTSTGVTSLKTLDADKFIPAIGIYVTSKSSLGGICTYSVGTNSPTYDNLIPGSTIMAYEVEEGKIHQVRNAPSLKFLNEQEIFINVQSAFSGTCVVDVYGRGFSPDFVG